MLAGIVFIALGIAVLVTIVNHPAYVAQPRWFRVPMLVFAVICGSFFIVETWAESTGPLAPNPDAGQVQALTIRGKDHFVTPEIAKVDRALKAAFMSAIPFMAVIAFLGYRRKQAGERS